MAMPAAQVTNLPRLAVRAKGATASTMPRVPPLRAMIPTIPPSRREKVVVFSLLLGGMVGIIARNGGTLGIVEAVAPFARTARRGKFVTWAAGMAIFFDDYANTLIVGNTMRPITDRLKVSRERLAYIVDSTAAPMACLLYTSDA